MIMNNIKKARVFFTFAIVSIFILWSFYGVGFSIIKIIKGLPNAWELIEFSFPPKFGNINIYVIAMIETIQIATAGTFLAVFLAIPFGVEGAGNFYSHHILYRISRFILNATRSIHEIIMALIFVVTVGLGPLPGALAIGVHSIGMLGKFYAESIENINKGQLDALESVGVSKFQLFRYAILPQILPETITVILYKWEMNIRSATVLGVVGAGGIGLHLTTALKLFQYREAITIIAIILIVVIIIDAINKNLRSKAI